jgi:hypothetical protein
MAKKSKSDKPEASSRQGPPPFARWFWNRIFWLLGKHGRYFILTGGTCYCTWLVADAIKVYAGKQSTANMSFAMSLFADIRMAYTVSVTVGVTGIALYLRERSLHRQTRERLGGRITQLELRIDPSRESSKLTSKGLTRQEDE